MNVPELETYQKADGLYDLFRIIRDAFGAEKGKAETFIENDWAGESDIMELPEPFRRLFLAAQQGNVAWFNAQRAERERLAQEVLAKPEDL
jgi:hypothetical protein